MFSSREKYFQVLWYHSIRESESRHPRARSISYTLSCHVTLILGTWWFEAPTIPSKYLQRNRNWSRNHSNKNWSHGLGRAGSTPPQCCPHCSWVRTKFSPRKMMGKLHWCYHKGTFRKMRTYRFYPLGSVCYRKKIKDWYLKTSYHHFSTSFAILCAYWFFWFSSIFSGKWISREDEKSKDWLVINYCEFWNLDK